jgi:hypothetical protein
MTIHRIFSREAQFSAAVPDVVRGYTNAVTYKGATRYVSRFDAEGCTISFPIGFCGMVISGLGAAVYFFAFGLRPKK